MSLINQLNKYTINNIGKIIYEYAYYDLKDVLTMMKQNHNKFNCIVREKMHALKLNNINVFVIADDNLIYIYYDNYRKHITFYTTKITLENKEYCEILFDSTELSLKHYGFSQDLMSKPISYPVVTDYVKQILDLLDCSINSYHVMLNFCPRGNPMNAGPEKIINNVQNFFPDYIKLTFKYYYNFYFSVSISSTN
jgi:hypothetical protein